MKKKSILNRPMFRQVKSPAYGTGISANLVSNEERQKYNYGGRVRAAEGLDYRFYTDRGQKYVTDYMPQTQEDWTKLQQIKAKGLPFQTIDQINQEVQESIPGQEPWYDLSSLKGFGESTEDYAARMAYEQSPTTQEAKREDLLETRKKWSERGVDRVYPGLREERESVGLYTPGTDKSHPSQKGFGSPSEVIEEGSVTEETPIRSERQPPLDIRKEDYDQFLEGRKQNTEDIGTEPDGWETLMGELDKSAEAKKKLGKGNALMQAAAAAVKWSGAPTAEKRAAAISEGLTQVGETGMKTMAEGMDLKDKVKILKAMEDVKGGHKMDVWDAKLKEYYGPSMDIAKAELKMKEDAIKKLEAGQEPMAIYNEFLNDENKINIPQLKANKLQVLTDKKVEVALNDEEEKVFKMPENDGIVFIDRNNKVVRYVDGKKESVNEKTDEYFTWNKP